MSTTQRISAYILKSLIEKLQPSRFPGMPRKLAAFVGFVVGARYSNPAIAEVTVASDGTVVARIEGESAANHALGNYVDVLRTWARVVADAGLTDQEFYELQALFAQRVGFYGQTNA
jgi:hypothetical protein